MAELPDAAHPVSIVIPDARKPLPAAFHNPAAYQLLKAARQGDTSEVRTLLIQNLVDVNFADPDTGLTALHCAAAVDAVPVLRLLASRPGCDFTLKDKQGRTAATLAYEVADNPLTGRFLLRKETQQRRARS